MQKFKRLLAGFMMAISLLAFTPVAAHAEWRSDSKGWWYSDGNSYAQWWRQIDGKWYYFYSDGYMAKNTWMGSYYLGSDGAWTTAPASNTSSVSTTNDKTQMVYVASSGNGKKYHSDPNCSNMKGTRHITLSEAQSEGYTACSKCY
ncbi:hypothetical protein B0P06_005246 [Clostridium saccharoperbutylacetonicum]|uniref:Cell wall binding repeat-containing protein n=1 Tax=Clostridium saccharoperbutylacetonicum N1-4(HMT) TaxID=931276 RepID=M1LTW2_9CLOT|nr:hypothetical protein [Clostridium saccharoperbutylacetonicum]AGF56485.1 hypothetical protein Cspa_c27200 [Clostridium saccharoperbutylacetonicum N1-4(HMT)]NRT62768.1 hypothetical protein [Clostridium saccharoperbutylacetonicum]NSB26120.1 hypothetical protein [Clostridium saccharoperbutylacetonicum]NSB45475.1 hypothetical protein [Clostridium saccharoperbutylacetonicum]